MILALDFDGVAGDTSFEVFLISYNTYLKFFDTKLFGGKPFTFEKLNFFKKKKKEHAMFNYLVSYARTADENVLNLYLIDNGIKINNLSDFKKIRAKFEPKLKDFYNEFYKQRKILQKDMKEWAKLAIPYKKIVSAANKLKKQYKLVILTNKNTGAVYPQAMHFKLKITKKDIFDTSMGNNKREKLKLISKKFKTQFKDIIFVDDILENLTDTKSLGITTMLASWFQNDKEQMQQAKELGITLLTQDNFYNTIKEKLK